MDIRGQFPQLKQKVRGHDLVYLDSGATTLKPQAVIDRIDKYYSSEVANIHRGAHYFGDQGTVSYEDARAKVAKFLGARNPSEVIFTRGTTESINFVAEVLERSGHLTSGDTVVLSELEHHSNIVPWLMLKKRLGLRVEFIPILGNGDLDLEAAQRLLKSKPKLLAITHLSNALGTLVPIETLINEARRQGVLTLIDGAQAVAAEPVEVSKLGCDFYVFSAHKVFGPTGVGILYGKLELLEKLPPYQGGGSMIAEVSKEDVSFLPPPQRFEAGTPVIAGALGLATALDFVNQLGWKEIRSHKEQLVARLLQGLSTISQIRLIGEPRERRSVVSFLLGDAHPSDVGVLLDQQGIAVRAGHHCCQPLMTRLKIPGTVRVSLSVYNNNQDIDLLVSALHKAKEILL